MQLESSLETLQFEGAGVVDSEGAANRLLTPEGGDMEIEDLAGGRLVGGVDSRRGREEKASCRDVAD